jgi:hypothetical protein
MSRSITPGREAISTSTLLEQPGVLVAKRQRTTGPNVDILATTESNIQGDP